MTRYLMLTTRTGSFSYGRLMMARKTHGSPRRMFHTTRWSGFSAIENSSCRRGCESIADKRRKKSTSRDGEWATLFRRRTGSGDNPRGHTRLHTGVGDDGAIRAPFPLLLRRARQPHIACHIIQHLILLHDRRFLHQSSREHRDAPQLVLRRCTFCLRVGPISARAHGGSTPLFPGVFTLTCAPVTVGAFPSAQ